MLLGLFGGTFDPVHYGHLLLAECCREQLGLDQVWFMPAAMPPHKRDAELTDGMRRVDMLRLATGGQAAFVVSTMELDRGGVSYTVDTLKIASCSNAEGRMFLLIGSDSLADCRHGGSRNGFANWQCRWRFAGRRAAGGFCRTGEVVAAERLKKMRRIWRSKCRWSNSAPVTFAAGRPPTKVSATARREPSSNTSPRRNCTAATNKWTFAACTAYARGGASQGHRDHRERWKYPN